jgi:2-aminoadipate transaminase
VRSAAVQTRWADRYAQRTQAMRSSMVRELLKLTTRPDIISFAGGLPGSDLFPLKRFGEACRRVLKDHGPEALQYSTTEGERPLRELIARHTRRYGIGVEADNVLITSGSQQALDLIGKVFLNAGDHVLVERPTYLGALQAWNAYQAEYLSVDIDDEGMRTDNLERGLRSGPKFIYALPNFQNPSGVTLSLQRRQTLIRLADQHGVPILEDDPYGQIRYEGDHLPSLVAMDAEYRGMARKGYSGNVLYMSTFSKTLAPGLRLGWIIGPSEVVQRLVQAKQGVDLHTSTFTQLVAYEVATGGFLDRHVRTLRRAYKSRRDAMLAAMSRSFPSEVTWTKPAGGLFVWATLPTALDAADVLRDALRDKVAFVPGSPFFADGSGHNTMRLNFTNASVDLIEEGMARLGRMLTRRVKHRGDSRVGGASLTKIRPHR